MQRWGGNQKKVPKWKMKKEAEKALSKEEQDTLALNKKNVELLTSLSDQLMAKGHFEVYELTFEQIKSKLTSIGMIDDAYQPGQNVNNAYPESEQELFWEFKWGEDAEEIHGPFPNSNMKAWRDQGYFDQSVKAWVRKVTSTTPLDHLRGFEEFKPDMHFFL